MWRSDCKKQGMENLLLLKKTINDPVDAIPICCYFVRSDELGV